MQNYETFYKTSKLNPVEVPNAQQNTPPIEELNEQIAKDEAARNKMSDFARDKAELLRQFWCERRGAVAAWFKTPNRQGIGLPRKDEHGVRTFKYTDSD